MRHVQNMHSVSSCRHCDNVFHSAVACQAHYKRKHEPAASPLQCKRCDNLFATNNSLARHVQVVHDQQKPFLCRRCNPPKAFGERHGLQKHRDRMHSGQQRIETINLPFENTAVGVCVKFNHA